MKNQEWLTATVWQYPVASVFVPDEHDESAIMISISHRTTGERGGLRAIMTRAYTHSTKKERDLLCVCSRMAFGKVSSDLAKIVGH
jgi:hypothetical protein